LFDRRGRSILRDESLAERPEDRMLGDLDLVLGEERPAVGVEEVRISEVDVPLDADAGIEDRAVVVEAVANHGQSGSADRVDLADRRKRDSRPPLADADGRRVARVPGGAAQAVGGDL
jgi:hypothetical protein